VKEKVKTDSNNDDKSDDDDNNNNNNNDDNDDDDYDENSGMKMPISNTLPGFSRVQPNSH